MQSSTTSPAQPLTGNKRSDAQARSLNHMGIEHKSRPDGSVVVLRAHVEKVLGLKATSQSIKPVDDKINWDAVRA
ncbi:DUF4224 domain-containing protein [Methylophilus sp. Leaf408]|uniref:DUF4224 domain-containing protein n=1 Tax=Methylophilus sp. Leaf408 TaxID=2876561 RepID=UPI00351CC77B